MVLNPLRVKICYKKMGIFQQNARARARETVKHYIFSLLLHHIKLRLNSRLILDHHREHNLIK